MIVMLDVVFSHSIAEKNKLIKFFFLNHTVGCDLLQKINSSFVQLNFD